MSVLKTLCFLLLFVCYGIHSSAQEDYYTISGTIQELSGEALPGAIIQINVSQKGSVADQHGVYRIEGLSDGTYQLKVTHLGYKPQVKTVMITGSNLTENFILTPSSSQLNEVEVTGDRYRSGPTQQSMTIQTVNRSFLERNNNNTFVNSLQKIPGISAINTGVGIAKPMIRGLSHNRVIVNDKGIKQEGQQWGTDHGLEIDQYAPERVEIIKGPSSLLYGSDGIGGVINILPAPPPPENTLTGSFLSAYKSNNNLLGTSTMLQGNKNGKLFRLRFSTQDFGDYRVPADSFTYNRFVLPIFENALKNTAGKERNISAMLGTTEDWGLLTLSVTNFNQKAGFFSGALGIPREYQLTDDGNSRNIDIPRQVTNHVKVIANANIAVNKDWMKIDIGYQNNYRREESNPHAHGKGPKPEGNLALGLTLQTVSANVKYHHKINEKIESIYGFQGQYQKNERSGFEFLLSNFTAGNAGAFLYQEYTITPVITINSGIRYDYGFRHIAKYEQPVYSDSTTIIGYNERTGPVERQFSNFSGAMGISYYPDRKFNAKLNLGTSFRMPSAPELSSNGIHHGTFRHEFGDSTLTSERGWQADLNLTYHTRKFHASFTPFYNYFSQFIYLSPTAQFSTLPEGGQIYSYTQDNAVFAGGETIMEYQLLSGLQLKTAIEYVWNYNLNSNLGLPFTPPFSVLGEAEYTFSPGGTYFSNVFCQVSVQHFSAQNRVDRNEKTTPGYTLVHFASGFDLKLTNLPLKLLFSIKNIINTPYMNHLSRYRLLNLPEQGRNVNVTIKIPFTLVNKK